MSDSFNIPNLRPISDDLVTIATCESQSEFLVIRSLLESAGIECYSPNENQYRVKGRGPLYSKEIPVQVLASQAEEAIALLKDAEAHPKPESPEGADDH